MQQRFYLIPVVIFLAALVFIAGPVRAEELQTNGLIMDSDGKNLFVLGVIKGSSADKAGVKKGDVIVAYKPVGNSQELSLSKVGVNNSFQAISKAGRGVWIKVNRGGETKEFDLSMDMQNVTPGDMPDGIPRGTVNEVMRSVLRFNVDKPGMVNSEDEFLLFKDGKMVCLTKIRKDNDGKMKTYSLSIPRSQLEAFQGAELIFYNHRANYYIQKQLKAEKGK